MNDNHDRQSVYEIGYLIATSVAEEHVPAEADKVRKILNDAAASVITEEAPHLQPLAYTMRRKTISGSYDKFDQAYFGWIKFEVGTNKAVEIKKAVENIPSILRMLMITTVRDNTYLGKRAPAILGRGPLTDEKVAVRVAQEAPATPATIEEMDKSIDEMVKEV